MEKEQDILKNKESLSGSILKPPKEFLDFIQYGVDPEKALGHVPGRYWLEMKLSTFEDTGGYAHIASGILASVGEFYRKISHKGGAIIGEVFIEAISNAAFHGNKKDKLKNIIVGVWYGKKGILFGIRDEGEFFSKEQTKKLIESRTQIDSTGGEKCFGIGLEGYIYKDADKIFVDTSQNTLFLAISKEKFTAKK